MLFPAVLPGMKQRDELTGIGIESFGRDSLEAITTTTGPSKAFQSIKPAQ